MSGPAVLKDLPALHSAGAEVAAAFGREPATLGGPLDAALPWHGLPFQALHEVSGLAATSAVAAMARRCLRRGGSLVWCRDRRLAGELGQLDGAGFARFGLTPERVTVTETTGEAETAAAFADALRCRRVACAIVEIGRLDPATGRQLQLAAEASGGVGLVLRPEFDAAPSAALTRWRAMPLQARDGIRWRLVLWHARGGAPGVWTVRWDEQRLAFAPVAPRARGGAPLAVRGPARRPTVPTG
jgi:protein ImuA